HKPRDSRRRDKSRRSLPEGRRRESARTAPTAPPPPPGGRGCRDNRSGTPRPARRRSGSGAGIVPYWPARYPGAAPSGPARREDRSSNATRPDRSDRRSAGPEESPPDESTRDAAPAWRPSPPEATRRRPEDTDAPPLRAIAGARRRRSG